GHACDDAGAGSSVAEQVSATGVAHRRRLAALHLDRPALLETAPDRGVIALHARVDDRHADALAGRAAEGPLAVDRLEGGEARQALARLRIERLGPGGQLLDGRHRSVTG